MDANLVVFDPVSVKLPPLAIGGYGNSANPRDDGQPDAVSQTEALPSGSRPQFSAEYCLTRGQVLVNRKAESLDHLLGFGPRHARSYQLSDHLDDVDGMNVGTLDDGLNLFVPGSWSMTASRAEASAEDFKPNPATTVEQCLPLSVCPRQALRPVP